MTSDLLALTPISPAVAIAAVIIVFAGFAAFGAYWILMDRRSRSWPRAQGTITHVESVYRRNRGATIYYEFRIGEEIYTGSQQAWPAEFSGTRGAVIVRYFRDDPQRNFVFAQDQASLRNASAEAAKADDVIRAR